MLWTWAGSLVATAGPLSVVSHRPRQTIHQRFTGAAQRFSLSRPLAPRAERLAERDDYFGCRPKAALYHSSAIHWRGATSLEQETKKEHRRKSEGRQRKSRGGLGKDERLWPLEGPRLDTSTGAAFRALEASFSWQPRSLKSPMPFMWRQGSVARQWTSFGSA